MSLYRIKLLAMIHSIRTRLFLFLLIYGLAQSGFSQSNPTFYRTFSVKVDILTETAAQVSARLNAIAPFEYVSTCSQSQEILVRIDAQDPKRVEAMEAELKAKLQHLAPDWKIKSLDQVPPTYAKTFCK